MDREPGASHRAVLLDFDDTLFDHARTSQRALAAVRRSTAELRPVPVEALWRRYSELLEAVHPDILLGRISIDAARRDRFRALARLAGGEIDPGRADELVADYQVRYRALRRSVPGARALLRYLRPRARVAIVSNNRVSEQEEKLAFLGFGAWVDTMVVSEGVGVAKPDPRIFRIALDRLGVDAGSAVMIGDSWANDVEGARSAGVRAIWFNRFRAAPPVGAVATKVPELRALTPASDVARLAGLR